MVLRKVAFALLQMKAFLLIRENEYHVTLGYSVFNEHTLKTKILITLSIPILRTCARSPKKATTLLLQSSTH